MIKKNLIAKVSQKINDMKKILLISSIILVSLIMFSSCTLETKQSFKPNVSGASGEVIVLMNKSLWTNSVGDSLKAVLSQYQDGLPQPEPLFDIHQIPHNAFSSMFKTHRNIIDLRVGASYKKPSIKFKNNFYSSTQAFLKLEAPSELLMKKLLSEKSNQIISYFLLAERKRKIKILSKHPVREIFDKLVSKFDFSLSFPSGFAINKDAKDFLWVSHETPRSSQGMFIYSFEYTSEKQLTREFLTKTRDSLLKAHVPGPTRGSYMKTETRFPMTLNYLKFNDNYCLQSRGLWRVENDFMGGPMLCYSFLDKKQNRIICLDSYVYFPNKKKREKLRELESIIYSYKKIETEKE